MPKTVMRCWLLVVTAAIGIVLWRNVGLIDLRVYQFGGRAWLDDVRLYTDFVAPMDLPFTYPPFAAVLFSAIAVLPWMVSVALWVTAGLVLFSGACLVAAWHVPQRTLVLGLSAAVAALALEPVWHTLELGQVNLLLAGLVALDCLLPKTPWPRGLLIGFAASVKLTPAIFVLFFLPRRQWRPALTAAASFAGFGLVAWALAPQDSARFWFHAVLDPSRVGGLGYSGNQSLRGLLFRLGIGTPVWILACLAVVVIAWIVVRNAEDDLTALLGVAAAGLLVSPISWSHHWVWIGPALVWLYTKARRWLLPVAAVFLVAPHLWLPAKGDVELRWVWWQHLLGNSYVLLGSAFLVVLLVKSTARRIDAVVQTT